MSVSRVVSYVYVMYCYEDGLSKIGVTNNIDRREKQVRCQRKAFVEIMLWGETTDPFKIERYLHRTFRVRRVYGEWFDLGERDLEFIKALVQA